MNFKLLAIRPLDGCIQSVLNILKPDTTYYFDETFDYDVENKYLIKKTDVTELPKDFFYKKEKEDSTLSYVNVQAIVGKNGSGKSSLVELLLRILNNFFKQYRLSEVTDNLVYAKGVKAELFFLSNDIIHKIFVDTLNLVDFKLSSNPFKEPLIEIQYQAYDSDCNALKSHLTEKSGIREENFIELQNLFFSMYINYSLYGMDSADFIDETVISNLQENIIEDISWLDSIFHKNDGYQTPVVIHPYRKESQINVRNEKELLNQRLVSLIINEKDYIKLTEKIVFKSLKLESVKQNIINHKIDEILNAKYKKYRVNNYDDNIFFIKNGLEDSDDKKLKNEQDIIDLIHDFYIKIIQRYNLSKKEKKDINDDYELYSQFLIYFVSYEEEIKGKDLSDEKVREKIEEVIKEKFSKEYRQKLDIIFNFFINYNFSQLSKILSLDIYYEYWLKNLNINEPVDDKFERTLFEYIVVKSYKTIRYPKYGQYERKNELLGFVPNNFQLSSEVKENHNQFLDELVEDSTHVSTKLRQSIKIFEIKDKAPKLFNLYKEEYLSAYNSIKTHSLDIKHIRNFVQETVRETKIEPIYLIPPPIFNLDIEVSMDNSDKVHSIKKISSGEFQFLAMISSIIYHLKNLDSVEERYYKGKSNKEYLFQYKNVSVILDEIELYFHPEFQRNFIYEIIKRLKDLSFKNIQAISFLFITHSPFILSDIPSQNILKLDDGFPKLKDEFNSFASNIYDLLKDDFFMNGRYVGEFSFHKIEKIITDIRNENINYNTLKIIDLIGEPLLKNKLREMVRPLCNNKKIKLEKKETIKLLQKQIDELKNEL